MDKSIRVMPGSIERETCKSGRWKTNPKDGEGLDRRKIKEMGKGPN